MWLCTLISEPTPRTVTCPGARFHLRIKLCGDYPTMDQSTREADCTATQSRVGLWLLIGPSGDLIPEAWTSKTGSFISANTLIFIHSGSRYWIIVVEAELFGVQAWIRGMLDSSRTAGAALVPLQADFRHSAAAQMWMGQGCSQYSASSLVYLYDKPASRLIQQNNLHWKNNICFSIQW